MSPPAPIPSAWTSPAGVRVDPPPLIVGFAARQHGVVGRGQLLAAGVSRDLLDSWLRRGRLAPLHRGVYQASPILGPRAREVAAVLCCGPGTLVSHLSAAAARGLVQPPEGGAPVAVIVQSGRRAGGAGIVTHHCRPLPPDEWDLLDGVPTTTAARTLLDIALLVGTGELERALARAERGALVRDGEVAGLLERHRGHRGVAALREKLAGEVRLTRSEAEALLLGLVRSGGLPHPETNVRLLGFEVDCFWREQRLVGEVDGYASHRGRRSFHSDRRRDARLVAAGYRVLRITWNDLTKERDRTLVLLAQALLR
jgi:very-short-patch-repair endonuclease